MRLNINDIGGKVVKEDDRYVVVDNTFLNNLIVSSTDLKPGKATSGHSHAGQEEVYNFVKGKGQVKIENEVFPVSEGDMVLIEDGKFHQVINSSAENLYFVCVFNGFRSH